ncbi:MAG TPA: PhnD/SsuA/transferrin family substrate-binding protein [Ramlibacter sp.]|nr:PhnD/SsuA/transferrin family substrate-binding protein [Ramlibacter sp.]
MTHDLLPLSIALTVNERTRPLLDGRIAAQGIALHATALDPSELFWRQLHYGDFDVSEMSLSSLLIAVSRGDLRWVALPVFTSRAMYHTRILVRRDSGIERPADLKGRRVAVPEYQQTAAVWTRGVLQHEFGVHARDMEWYMERGADRSHASATGGAPPPGVQLHTIAADSSISEQLANGGVDAALVTLPPHRNLVDRSRVDAASLPQVRRLFADPVAESRRYFGRTGIYPINHAVVVRRDLLERHPWIALNLYHAFLEAKRLLEQEAAAVLRAYVDTGLVPADTLEALAHDPKAYGTKAANATLQALVRYSREQGLIEREVSLDELFAPSTLEL